MEKKRKNSGFSDELDYDGEAEDIEYDLRLVRRWKRRCIANKDTKHNSATKNCSDEGNYSEASKDTLEANAANDDDDDDDDDNDESFVDADYKKFLDSISSRLTGDDDSVLNHRTFDSGDDVNTSMQTANKVISLEINRIEMGGNSGDIVDASYPTYLDIPAPEDENACCINRKTDVNAVDGFAKKGKNGEKLVGNKFMDTDAYDDASNFNGKKRKSNCVDHVDDLIENEDSGCVDVDSSQTQPAENHTCQNDELDNTDPDYDFFLKNMNTDWDDSLSNCSKDSGPIDDVDTSQNDDLDDPDDDLSPKDDGKEEDENVAFCNFSDGGSGNDTSQNEVLDNYDPDYEFFLKNVRQEGTSFVLEIPECDGISQIIKYEVGDGCSRVENPDTSRSRQEEGSLECDLLDESYDIFMKALKDERGLLAFIPENGPKVVYDEDEEESSSDSDVVILETNPTSQSYEIILSDDDEEIESDKIVSKSNCWFREKVVEILKKPFDQAEYDRLLHDASVHKPVTEDRDMRYGRSRTRVVNTFGKSYLEIHKDLGRKINGARSKPKVLNLLRGFFYWLQNTPHGVFKPWEDKLCLQVLPSEVASRPVLNLKKEKIY